MIHRQELFPPKLSPHPHPPPLHPPPKPPQQQRSRMIHRQELFPLEIPPFSHPHPQFVALNSLINKSSDK